MAESSGQASGGGDPTNEEPANKVAKLSQDVATIEIGGHDRAQQEVASTKPKTNAIDDSKLAVWCKGKGLGDYVIQALQTEGFRNPNELRYLKAQHFDRLQLKLRDQVMLEAAIEGMRNPRAEDAGLAARGDAPTDAQRAAQLDERIRETFQTYRRENTLEWQEDNMEVGKLLWKALPCTHDKVIRKTKVDMSCSPLDSFVGTTYSNLVKALENNFDQNSQLRRTTVLLQAFGCGKTRAALQLAADYVVLPLEMTPEQELIHTLISSQRNLREAVGAQPTGEQIRQLSASCLRLVHLIFFTLIAFFEHCVAKNYVDPADSTQRHQLAILLRLKYEALVGWTVAYFKQHEQGILSMKDKEFEKLVNEAASHNSQPVLVFILDEAHGIRDECRGFCLHQKPPTMEPELIQQWLTEQKKDTDGNVTNLLYQFRRVSQAYLKIQGNRNAFVMCSTMFKIWNDVVDQPSPVPRTETEIYSNFHWFTTDEVQRLIQRYLKVENELFTRQHTQQQLSKFRRPSFVVQLVEKLVKTGDKIASDGKVMWFDDAVGAALADVKRTTLGKVARLVNPSMRLEADSETARSLVYLVYTIERLCGGKFHHIDETIVDLIDSGVVRLTRDKATCDDPLFIEAVDEIVQDKLANDLSDPVMAELLAQLKTNVIGNTTGKGPFAERVLAWLALKGGLKVTTLNSEFTFEPNSPAVCRAGTAQQLEERVSEADFVWCVVTDLSRSWILFPSNFCGPDLIFRQRNGGSRIVLIQSRMWNKVLTLSDFKEAMFSLHPIYFSKKPKDETVESDKGKSEDRRSWLSHAGQLGDFSFQRIVFAPLGFSLRVQYLVLEYNNAQQVQRGRNSAKYIHLLNLHDIKAQVSENNYRRLHNLVKKDNALVDVQEHEQLMLQSDWMVRDRDLDDDLPIEVLKKMCELRDINMTHDAEAGKTWRKPKTKAELIRALDSHDVQGDLAKQKWDLP